MTEQRTSDDGIEMNWAVNVAAPFLLTSLLLDTVTERVINVSSTNAADHIDFGNLQQVGVPRSCPGFPPQETYPELLIGRLTLLGENATFAASLGHWYCSTCATGSSCALLMLQPYSPRCMGPMISYLQGLTAGAQHAHICSAGAGFQFTGRPQP